MDSVQSRGEIVSYIDKYKVNRNVKCLVVHCSATKPGTLVNVDVVDQWHKARGFSKQKQSGRYCGYHFLILEDGEIQIGRYLNEIGAHVAGNNSNTIGICYAGGINDKGKGTDTRTKEQKDSLIFVLTQLLNIFPEAQIKGHRDYSPDLNGDGVISSNEWIKECPCFDAMVEYKNI